MIELDTYSSGFVLSFFSTALAVLGLLVVRRWFHPKMLAGSHHEVGGFFLALVGTMYAVLLGLVVVEAIARFQLGSQTTDTEANALANIVLFTEAMPQDKRQEITKLAADYAKAVIEQEWDAMDNAQYSPLARQTAIKLVRTVLNFEPKTDRETAIYSAELSAVSELWNNRRIRIATSMRGIPKLEWVVLIAGGVITIVFTYFFRIDNLKIQIAMTSLLTLAITLNLFLVAMFGYPFSGDLRVDSDSFRLAQEIVESRGK